MGYRAFSWEFGCGVEQWPLAGYAGAAGIGRGGWAYLLYDDKGAVFGQMGKVYGNHALEFTPKEQGSTLSVPRLCVA